MFHLTVKNNKYKQMKKISLLLLAFIATLSFNACSDDDEFTFVAKPDPEGIAFENTVLDSYPLEASNGDNLAERFVWNAVDFGVSHTPEANDPLAPKLSLIHFKEQFGARGVLRVAYQKDYCGS